MNKNLKPISIPIIVSSTFAQKTPCQEGYSRVDNPTRLELEKELAKIEKAKFALAFSSGSAAITTIFGLLKRGDHIICHEEVYEGTLRLLNSVFKKFGVDYTLVDLNNEKLLINSIKKNTKLVWLENITNPTLNSISVKKVAKSLKRTNVKLIVDNTFATPIFCHPLLEGADIVVHSLTKFIGGHHDAITGGIMLNDNITFEKLHFLQHTIGAIPSPFDCFFIKRGIETLEIRMLKHQENAIKVTAFLKDQKAIKKVIFPGISGIIAFWLKRDNAVFFLKRLKMIKIAHSLGGTITTVLHPTSMMTFSLSTQKREKLGVTNNLLRLSVGLEDASIIIDDLKQALH